MPDNSALSALVVRNIGDIEAALTHAQEVIDERLFQDIGDAIAARFADSDWFVSAEVEDKEIWFSPGNWRPADVLPEDAPYWFHLEGQDGPGGGEEYSWLAAFLAAGPEGASVALVLNGTTFKSAKRWKALAKSNTDLIARLIDAGFRQNDAQRLYLPLHLDADVLAAGFEDDDLTTALKPLQDALDVIEAARQDLDALIAYDRQEVDAVL